jgi:hypothetical protein
VKRPILPLLPVIGPAPHVPTGDGASVRVRAACGDVTMART